MIYNWVTKSRNSKMPLQATRNYNCMRSKDRIWIWGLKSLVPKMGEKFCLQNSGDDSLEKSCVNPGRKVNTEENERPKRQFTA